MPDVHKATEIAGIADLGDRARFVALVREAMAGSIENGEPLPEVRLRQHPKAALSAAMRDDEPTR